MARRGLLDRLRRRRAAPSPTPTAPAPARVPAEVLKQVKRVELGTRRLVDALFAGEYRSVFKGQGMEFAEVREYMPGDEVRSIDWNVTARMRRPFVKRYIEERELTVMMALDVSASEDFGTQRRLKSDTMVEFAAVVALAAVRNNDRVGVLFFTDEVEHVVPPRKGKRHVLRILRDLLAYTPRDKRTDLVPALEHLQHTLRQHTVVFVVSDFQATGFEHALRVLHRRHDVIAVTLEDRAEEALPDVGVVRLRDPETDQVVEVDTSARAVRRSYDERMTADRERRERLFRRLGIDEIVLDTEEGVAEPLLRFFRMREKRGRTR